MRGADEMWQAGYLLAAALVVLSKAWHGWKIGVVRQVLSLIAAGVATACGIYFGRALTPGLRIGFTYPDRVLAVIGGLLVGLVVFLILSLLNALLFKKTSEQSVALIRWGYGLSGAVVGAAYGLFFVVLFTLGLRVLGGVAQAQLAVQKRAHERAGQAAPRANPAIETVARLSHALGQGLVGEVLHTVDPLPEAFYARLAKFGLVMADPHCLERFSAYPGARTLMQHPKLAALVSDGELSRAAGQRNYGGILTNPNVIAALNDPEVVARLERFEWEKALDYALSKPDNDRTRAAP